MNTFDSEGHMSDSITSHSSYISLKERVLNTSVFLVHLSLLKAIYKLNHSRSTEKCKLFGTWIINEKTGKNVLDYKIMGLTTLAAYGKKLY